MMKEDHDEEDEEAMIRFEATRSIVVETISHRLADEGNRLVVKEGLDLLAGIHIYEHNIILEFITWNKT